MRPFLVLPLLVLALVACTGSDSSSNSDEANPGDSTPTVDVPRPAFRLEFDDTTGAAEWERVDAAAAYRVTGHVVWWPDCAADDVEPSRVEIDEVLPPETLIYPLPRPEDEVYTRIKEFVLLVQGLNAEDDVIAYQNTGQFDERLCPQ